MKKKILNSNEQIHTLINLGLTLSEAKVFFHLAKCGNATAKTIAKKAMVTPPDIYRIMPRLQELGLIERIVATPIRFKAVTMPEAVSILMKKKTLEISDLWRKSRKLIIEFKENQETGSKEDTRSEFVLIPEKRAKISQKISAIISGTVTLLCCAIPTKRFLQATTIYTDEIKKAIKRGVEFKIITEKSKRREDFNALATIAEKFKVNPLFKIRYSETPIITSFWIRDQKEVEIFLSPTYGRTYGKNTSPALWSQNSSLVNLVQDYFEKLWDKSRLEL